MQNIVGQIASKDDFFMRKKNQAYTNEPGNGCKFTNCCATQGWQILYLYYFLDYPHKAAFCVAAFSRRVIFSLTLII